MNRNSGDFLKCGRIGLHYYYYCPPEEKVDTNKSVQLILPPKLEPTKSVTINEKLRKNVDYCRFHLSPKSEPTKSVTTGNKIRRKMDVPRFIFPPKLEPTKYVTTKRILRKNVDHCRFRSFPKSEPTKSVTTSRNIIQRNIDSIKSILPSKLKSTEPVTTKNSLRKSADYKRHLLPTKLKIMRPATTWNKQGDVDSIGLIFPPKPTLPTTKRVPHFKIIAGTHFAVDAFSYGEIPHVTHYFLTHFHSDHYSGLKKGFNKTLHCSRITAHLCISRLGVSPKCIHVIKPDETIRVEGIEVTAVDANHCPGALMLVFTLPNGKTLLHTGDFRATPAMESYPIFWNKEIHTIYLDTTYCNPRYDFPTQDQILEISLYLLRQKKLLLEKDGKKFSSVLIVCGAYTIGKEKFFLGIARRVGCSVWASPQKVRALRGVKGRGINHAPPEKCQLHVVPMDDMTHEKLRKYLDSYKGAFNEVVAFKPSGWENGKNSTIKRDNVTIHGIPYSDHSSFSEIVRFVKFLKPKLVVPTVNIIGGTKAIQIYYPHYLLIIKLKEFLCKNNLTFNISHKTPTAEYGSPPITPVWSF